MIELDCQSTLNTKIFKEIFNTLEFLINENLVDSIEKKNALNKLHLSYLSVVKSIQIDQFEREEKLLEEG